jgi:starvation-inducible DNA-binding protein
MTRQTFKTRIDIPSDARNALVTLINQQLVDLLDLHSQAKYAHWNVKGSHFIAYHELFDKLAETLDEAIDEVAERATALGGVAVGTVRHAATQSRVAEFPQNVFDGMSFITAFADRMGTVANSTRAAIDAATKLGDADTADLFTGLSRELDKSLWFLESHLEN